MKKLLIFGNFLVLTLALQAQTEYFLFIQSEHNQAFYVQREGKTLSSSATGHLIIPGLRDTLYTLTLGFPKNQFPEQVFQIRINRKDGGYQLKNMGAEGWALYNLQTLQLIKAQQTTSKKNLISYGDVKKTDDFSTLMAGLVNDSAVLYTSIAKVEPVKMSSTTGIPDTPVSNSITKRDENPVSDPVASKSGPPAVKTEVPKVENPLQNDSLRLQPVTAKLDEIVPKDTPSAKTQTPPPQDLKASDTSIAKSIPSKADSLGQSGPDTIRAEVAGEPDYQKKDTLYTNAQVSKELQVPATDKSVETPKLPSVINDQARQVKEAPIKPLIVWFSETKTDRGTELVYIDLSVPDMTDTIRMLIPREDAVSEGAKQEKETDTEIKKEDEKTGAGKFFGKLFGKKDNNESAGSSDKKKSKPKESTITVTTVENNKVVDSPSTINQRVAPQADESASNVSEKQEKEKNSSGNFFDRIFGKKNEKAPGDSAKVSSATVKVTTVEEKSSDSTNIRNMGQGDKDAAEVEKLKKAQEDEEKTSTQRFFGKLFGKKSSNVVKDTTAKSPNQSNAQPSVAETSAVESKQKGVIVTNSDCRQFASDSELDKLRVRMLAEKDVDAQVTEARKFFKVKCVSTSQVQSLTTLFRTDEGRYKLLDAAYPYVSDNNNFRELVALLTEEYYINRFKAMVRM